MAEKRTDLTLSRVRPMATESQEALAERVDHVFRQVEQYLRNFKAPDSEAVDGVPGSEVSANRMVGLFIQTFENDIVGYWTNREGGTDGITYPNNGTTGGKVFKASNHRFFEFPENIPYDPRMVYRLRCRVKITAKDADGAGENQFRWGLQGYAADGTTIVDRLGGSNPSSPHIVGADRDMSGDTLDEFVEIEAYLSGHGAFGSGSPGTMDDLATMQNGVAYVRPFFEVNADGGDGTMEVDYLAFDVLTVDDEIDSLLTRNGPIEKDAEQTAGKDFSLLVSRFFENLIRSSTNNTELSVVVSKVDDVGDLEEFVLMDDGAEKRVIAKGTQEGSAADGDSVSFDPVFNNTPTVFFRPTGVTWAARLSGERFDSLDLNDDTVSPSSDIADPGIFELVYDLEIIVDGQENEGLEVDVVLEEDDGTGFVEIDRHKHRMMGDNDVSRTQELTHRFLIQNDSADSTYDYRLTVEENEIQFPQNTQTDITGGGLLYKADFELFWKVVADGLTASGFDLVAKLVERAITTVEVTDSFPAGTITSVGGTHALGGLSDDPDTDDVEVQFDGSLSVTSTDDIQSHDEDFPAGVLDAVGESKEVSISEEASDDNYDVRYDVDMEVTADVSTSTQSDPFPAGIIDAVGESKAVTVSESVDGDGSVTVSVPWSISANCSCGAGGFCTASASISLEVFKNGTSMDTFSSPLVSCSGDQSDSDSGTWTPSFAASEGDVIKVEVTNISESSSGTASANAEADPDDVEYTTSDSSASIDMTVEVQSSTDNGSSWNTDDSTVYSVEDTDGTGDSLSQSVEKTVSRDGVTDIRVIVTDITETGTLLSQQHECDPNDVQWETGSADRGDYQITVALDSKDGTDAWVERDTKKFTVTDNTGNGNTKTLTDELLSFVDSLIQAGDDVRLRVKSDKESGGVASSSFSIDPELARYWDVTGPETEHSMTPIEGDEIAWVALTG